MKEDTNTQRTNFENVEKVKTVIIFLTNTCRVTIYLGGFFSAYCRVKLKLVFLIIRFNKNPHFYEFDDKI